MTVRAGPERRVDEHATAAAFLDEQLEVVCARRALLKEELAAGALHLARDGRVARELLDAPQQRRPPRNRVEHGARVGVLALEEGQPFGILVVLHPAIRIA